MPREYRYVSADSHLEIDSKHWIPRMPERYRDRAPRVVRLPDCGYGPADEDKSQDSRKDDPQSPHWHRQSLPGGLDELGVPRTLPVAAPRRLLRTRYQGDS